MRETLARSGLKAVESLRVDVSSRTGVRISRAALARRGGLNDATVTRGLSTVPPRITTVTRYAGALLGAIADLSASEPATLSHQPVEMRTQEAARALAFAVGDLANAKGSDIRRAKRIRMALDVLKDELCDRVIDHVRLESAFARIVAEWLDAPDDAGVRLAAIGTATAVVCRQPMARAAEAAHV